MSRKTKDLLTQAAIYISAGFTVFILVVIIGFVLIKGLPSINLSFLTRTWEDTTSYGFVQSDVDSNVIQEGSVDALGITLKEGAKGLEIVSMDQDSILKTAINAKGAPVKLQKGDFIVKADRQDDGSLRIKSIPSRRRHCSYDRHHHLYDSSFSDNCCTHRHFVRRISD